MSASDTLEFNCPNCQVRLLVPKSKAGISGPCPHCGASITSPSPIPAPLRNNPVPAPPDQQRSAPPRESLPTAPQRKIPSPPQKQQDDISEDQKWSDEDEEEKKGGGCWLALLFLLFLIVAAYFVLSFLSLVPDWRTISSKLFPKAQKIEQVPAKSAKDTGQGPAPSKPIVNTPPAPEDVEPLTDPFEHNEDTNTPRETLKQFLSAKTFQERLPLMTTSSRSEEDLRQSILSKQFPEAHPPQIESKLSSPGGEDSVSYYTVSFRTSLSEDVSKMTVKVLTKAGSNSPKVDTDFFLDLLKAPVTELNQNISPDPLTFQAIIEGSAYCFDDIPNSDSMARLILFREVGSKATPLSTAYLAQTSPIFLNLKNKNALGIRIPATVTVKWNQTIDPAKPFLEVIALKTPDLN